MYDYATVSMQNRILTELQTLNSNFVVYNETFMYLLIILIISFLSFCVYKFVLRCLGK